MGKYYDMHKRILDRSAVLFAALGHPTRLKIVEQLVAHSLSVNEISQILNIGQSGASQHLAILARAGVLVVHPRGTTRVYAVRGPRIGRIVALIQEFCEVHDLQGDDDIITSPDTELLERS
jgi:DNA-binding transcriptional ArsR family regulator